MCFEGFIYRRDKIDSNHIIIRSRSYEDLNEFEIWIELNIINLYFNSEQTDVAYRH